MDNEESIENFAKRISATNGVNKKRIPDQGKNSSISFKGKNIYRKNSPENPQTKKLVEDFTALRMNSYHNSGKAKPNSFEMDLTGDSKEVIPVGIKYSSLTKPNEQDESEETADDELIINYNFKVRQGRLRSIEIFRRDYRTLEETNYLNDTIVYFYLK